MPKIKHSSKIKMPDYRISTGDGNQETFKQVLSMVQENYIKIYDDLVNISTGRGASLPTANKDLIGKSFLLEVAGTRDDLYECVYDKNTSAYVWKKIPRGEEVTVEIAAAVLWEVDGTEHQLKTADEIDMQSKNIIALLDPTADQHAATKKYHDDDFDTASGHDHDGTDSKKVDYGDLLNTPADENTSNVIFHYQAAVNINTATDGEVTSETLYDETADIARYRYLSQKGQTEKTVLSAKWKKIAGVDTVTVYGQLASSNDGDNATLKVDIGGQNNSVAEQGAVFQWKNFDIDVSGLSDGTVYDISIILDQADNNEWAYAGTIIMFGS